MRRLVFLIFLCAVTPISAQERDGGPTPLTPDISPPVLLQRLDARGTRLEDFFATAEGLRWLVARAFDFGNDDIDQAKPRAKSEEFRKERERILPALEKLRRQESDDDPYHLAIQYLRCMT